MPMAIWLIIQDVKHDKCIEIMNVIVHPHNIKTIKNYMFFDKETLNPKYMQRNNTLRLFIYPMY